MERYSDFNSMIEQYEREMRKLFEESRRANRGFSVPEEEPQIFEKDEPVVQVFEGTKNIETDEKTGKIIVEVTTARGAVPISGATVVIDRFDRKDPIGRKELVAVLETNQSGRTKEVSVPAAEKELSLEPGRTDPFMTYYVSTREKGFVPVKDRPTDVFSGEVAILKIDLIPLPENLGEGAAKDG